jgi:LAO/AO transport system kinase
MVDVFVLLLAPGGGDELQGVKRGIVELADIVVVNKADGDLEAAARRTAADYAHALHMVRSDPVPVLMCSALTGEGIEPVWRAIERFYGDSDDRRRREQATAWMWSEVNETLADAVRDQARARAMQDVEDAVASGRMSPTAGARELLDRFSWPC